MIIPEFDPTRIRQCELVQKNNKTYIQFLAIGDKHRMLREDDGSIAVEVLQEAGKPYPYGQPYLINDAITILKQEHYPTHGKIAAEILAFMNKQQK